MLFEARTSKYKEVLMATTATTPALVKNILFATDFSPASEVVLPYARALARSYDAQLVIAHVVAPGIVAVEPPTLVNLADLAQEQMEQMQSSEALDGIRHKEIVVEGPIWESISRLIETHEIDLVVVGTHGRTGIGKFILGSVAEEIFRQAPCPVLTVGPHVSAALRRAPEIKTILFATDFSADCPGSLTQALTLSRKYDARLLLLHVAEDQKLIDPERVVNELHEKLAALVPPGTARIETLVEFGRPAERILATAEQFSADMIVLGAHRPAMLTNRFMDVAYRVTCEAPCPVLTCNALVQPFFNKKAFAATL
jgi:nucleotide-binding universal stress UspA family protein